MNCLMTRWKIDPIHELSGMSLIQTIVRNNIASLTLKVQGLALPTLALLTRAQCTEVVSSLGND